MGRKKYLIEETIHRWEKKLERGISDKMSGSYIYCKDALNKVKKKNKEKKKGEWIEKWNKRCNYCLINKKLCNNPKESYDTIYSYIKNAVSWDNDKMYREYIRNGLYILRKDLNKIHKDE